MALIVEFKIPILGVKVWIWIAVQLRGFIAIAYTRSKNTCVYIYIYICGKGKVNAKRSMTKESYHFLFNIPTIKSKYKSNIMALIS